ncbi:MAG: hypothetical protein WDN04_02895 [Rhodospirillales bacterium]
MFAVIMLASACFFTVRLLAGGLGGFWRVRKRVFFFEKKNQKTFVYWGDVPQVVFYNAL